MAAYSQRAMEDPLKFGFEPPKIAGELRTGTVDQKEMAELFGPEIAERKVGSFVQIRFAGVHGVVDQLFDTSATLCLEFEAKAAESGTHLEKTPESAKNLSRRDTARKSQTTEQNQSGHTVAAPTDKQVDAARGMVEKMPDVSIQHAAWYLGCSTSHVRRLVRKGLLIASNTKPKRITSASLRGYKWPAKSSSSTSEK